MARSKNKLPKKEYPRINLAFYDDHLKFLRYAAWRNHQSITQYVNGLVEKDMRNYARNEWDLPDPEGEGTGKS